MTYKFQNVIDRTNIFISSLAATTTTYYYLEGFNLVSTSLASNGDDDDGQFAFYLSGQIEYNTI